MSVEVLTIDELIHQLGARPDLDRRSAMRAMRRAAERAKTEAIWQQLNHGKYPLSDLGVMARSWHISMLPSEIVLENTAPYAVPLEFGAQPFWAPITPLLDWARRKSRGAGLPEHTPSQGPKQQLGPPISRTSLGVTYTHSTRAMKGSRERDAQRLARAVQRKFAREGIKPKGFFAAASQKFPAFVREEVARELRRKR
jgi:hypothetical protein